jgi:hypothetical protein
MPKTKWRVTGKKGKALAQHDPIETPTITNKLVIIPKKKG